MRKCPALRIITSVLDKEVDIQSTTKGILHTFVSYLQGKYSPIAVDLEGVIQMETAGHKTVPSVWRDFLDSPISIQELKAAANKCAGNKAPGRDGICLEYFKTNWDMIKGDMLVLFKPMYRICKIPEKTEAWDSSVHTEDTWALHTGGLQTHHLAKH
jgi:hypothetical protein